MGAITLNGFQSEYRQIDAQIARFGNKIRGLTASDKRQFEEEFSKISFSFMRLSKEVQDYSVLKSDARCQKMVDDLQRKVSDVTTLFYQQESGSWVDAAVDGAFTGTIKGLTSFIFSPSKSIRPFEASDSKQSNDSPPFSGFINTEIDGQSLHPSSYKGRPSFRNSPRTKDGGGYFPKRDRIDRQGGNFAIGSSDGNDWDKDRGATDSGRTDWSKDPRFEEANQLREIGKVYDRGARDHFEEGLVNLPGGKDGTFGRPYTAGDEFKDAFHDKAIAKDYYIQANKLENQVAQDAAREATRGEGGGGCTIS